jgi:hypothetical protein
LAQFSSTRKRRLRLSIGVTVRGIFFQGNGESVIFDRSFDILVSGIETNVLKV